MLECKCEQLIPLLHCFSELIDTCWNVNERAEQAREALELELIDTCWNVNIRRKHAAISE